MRLSVIACAGLMALPATAQDMTPETCRAGWEAFNLMIGETADMVSVQPDVTAKGWCRIDSSNAPLNTNDFGSLEFRGTGIEDAVKNQGAPTSLDVRIDGIDLIEGWDLPMPAEYGGPRGTANFSFQRDLDTREIIVKALDADFGGLGHVKITAQGGGVDLTSLNSMQITSGGARVHDLTLQLQATPVLKNALLPPIASAMGDIFVQAIPVDSIDTSSRDALSQFLASGSDTGGLLRLSAKSEAGMGFLQMVGGVMPLQEKGMSEDNLKSSMEILFSGVTLSAEWIGID